MPPDVFPTGPPPGLPEDSPRLLQVATYNPCNILEWDRRWFVSNELRNVDVIGIVGTGIRNFGPANDPDTQVPTVHKINFHTFINFGWSRSPYINKSCGGTIAVRTARFPQSGGRIRPRQIFLPPRHLLGRAGAVLLPGHLRLLVVFIYFPPRPLLARHRRNYEYVVQELVDWLFVTLHRADSGVKPLITFDLNDGLGIPEHDGDGDADALYIGRCAPEQEHFAATLLRKACRDLVITIANTHFHAGHTFWSTASTGKRLDYMACGLDFYNDNIQSCRVLNTIGRRLQLANTLRNWDHWPLLACFIVNDVAIRKSNYESHLPKWNRDKLRHGLQHGTSRQEFLLKLQEQIQERKAEIEDAFDNDPTPDRLDRTFISILHDSALPFYCNTNPDTKEVRKSAEKDQLNQDRLSLLAQRTAFKDKITHFHYQQSMGLFSLADSCHPDVEEYERVQFELTFVSRRIKSIKKKLTELDLHLTEDNITKSWNERAGKEAWQEATSLGCTAPGRKCKRFDRIMLQNATVEAWEERCKLPGPQGGFRAQRINLQEEHDKLISSKHEDFDPEYTKVPTPDHITMAQSLLKHMRMQASKLKSNKAVIDHSIPNEVLRVAIKPYWTYQRKDKTGLGHARKYFVPDVIEWLLIRLLAKVIANHLAPLRWHVAAGFTVQKANLKPGILGERLVAAMDPLGRIFYQILIDNPIQRNSEGNLVTPADVVFRPPHEVPPLLT